jgi:hypothetical protein
VGKAGHNLENSGCAVMRSVLLDHYLGRFDHSGYCIALFELQLVGTASGDCAFDEVVTSANDHMGHDIAKLNLFNFPTQFVSR